MIFAKPYTLQEQPVQALPELDKDKFHTAHEVFLHKHFTSSAIFQTKLSAFHVNSICLKDRNQALLAMVKR